MPKVRLTVLANVCATEMLLEPALLERHVQTAPDLSLRELRLEIVQHDAGFRGIFSISALPSPQPRLGIEHAAKRVIDAPSCGEITHALAFAIAIALERAREEDPLPPVAPLLEKLPDKVPETSPSVPLRALVPTPVTPTPRRLQWTFGVTSEARIGFAPSLSFAFGVFGELVSRAPGFTPSLRLTYTTSLPTSDLVGLHELRVAIQTASIEVCPAHLRGSRVAFTACPKMRVGRIQGAGLNFHGDRLDNKLWADVGGVARGEVDVAPNVVLQLELGIAKSLSDRALSFGVDDSYEVSAWNASGAVGAALRFR